MVSHSLSDGAYRMIEVSFRSLNRRVLSNLNGNQDVRSTLVFGHYGIERSGLSLTHLRHSTSMDSPLIGQCTRPQAFRSGETTAQNIAEPIHVYRVTLDGSAWVPGDVSASHLKRADRDISRPVRVSCQHLVATPLLRFSRLRRAPDQYAGAGRRLCPDIRAVRANRGPRLRCGRVQR